MQRGDVHGLRKTDACEPDARHVARAAAQVRVHYVGRPCADDFLEALLRAEVRWHLEHLDPGLDLVADARSVRAAVVTSDDECHRVATRKGGAGLGGRTLRASETARKDHVHDPQSPALCWNQTAHLYPTSNMGRR